MNLNYEFIKDGLSEREIELYTRYNKDRGLIPTGDCIRTYDDEGSVTHVIFAQNGNPFLDFAIDYGTYIKLYGRKFEK